MKKAILIASLALMGSLAFAQSVSQKPKPQSRQLKKDTSKTDTSQKVKRGYSYFYEVPVEDFEQITSALHDYKDGLVYNPLIKDHEQRSRQIQINAYLARLPGIVKLDSAKIDTATIRKPSIPKREVQKKNN